MALGNPFRSSPARAAAADLYRAVVAQSRAPEFYTGGGVPDTIDGRFDLVALHVALVVARLKQSAPTLDDLAQSLFDEMIANLDVGLREAGVGDMGVGRRMKKLVSAFYGRARAYEEALAQAPDGALIDALRRNLFRAADPGADTVDAMAGYVRSQFGRLQAQSEAELRRGRIDFLPLAGRRAGGHGLTSGRPAPI